MVHGMMGKVTPSIKAPDAIVRATHGLGQYFGITAIGAKNADGVRLGAMYIIAMPKRKAACTPSKMPLFCVPTTIV